MPNECRETNQWKAEEAVIFTSLILSWPLQPVQTGR